jgi:hypothetical protein
LYSAELSAIYVFDLMYRRAVSCTDDLVV